ncbi:helix-hairpin-helix domain-containing protein [Nocardiopsis sp. L17-MgMaSL7]|uniref:helix-hairpin-helix domain-containing protein n=1 Tax=Nocardiopsis sp. L17-MgMaSL7 TaxID=1938893 RepID=UPI000D911C48|nr:helix-hairpin-helix domain-containing protein [Nocardiopsis sp. L17-MgMaSL7]PWV57956.1 comEA protein [Nocardiopsis sp. L17-MgMaSL7]
MTASRRSRRTSPLSDPEERLRTLGLGSSPTAEPPRVLAPSPLPDPTSVVTLPRPPYAVGGADTPYLPDGHEPGRSPHWTSPSPPGPLWNRTAAATDQTEWPPEDSLDPESSPTVRITPNPGGLPSASSQLDPREEPPPGEVSPVSGGAAPPASWVGTPAKPHEGVSSDGWSGTSVRPLEDPELDGHDTALTDSAARRPPESWNDAARRLHGTAPEDWDDGAADARQGGHPGPRLRTGHTARRHHEVAPEPEPGQEPWTYDGDSVGDQAGRPSELRSGPTVRQHHEVVSEFAPEALANDSAGTGERERPTWEQPVVVAPEGGPESGPGARHAPGPGRPPGGREGLSQAAARPPSGYTELSPEGPGSVLERVAERWGSHSALSRRAVVALLVVGLLAVAGAFLALRDRPEEVTVSDLADQASPVGHDTDQETAPGDGGGTGEESAEPGGDVVVHVGGEVAEPGLYTMPAGSRVADAVEEAGGPLPEADLDLVNLARPLTDGERVLVGVPQPDGGSGDGPEGSGPLVNLNLAGQAELETLPGIGQKKAQQILAHRESLGGAFSGVEDLLGVEGIAEKTFRNLEPHVTVG